MDASQVRALANTLRGEGARAQKLVSAVVRKSATDVEANAKSIAPVDTGNLKNSIGMTVDESGTSVVAEIGPTANYAPHVEYGTHKMAAQPYMQPALARVEPAFERAMNQLAGRFLK